MNQRSEASPFYAIWDERLTDQEKDRMPSIRNFCEEVIVGFADEAERSRIPMQKSVAREWAKLGMLGLQTPIEYGGLGASYFAKIRTVQELARRSFACAFSLNNMQSLVYIIATRATEEVRKRFLRGLLSGEQIASVALTEPGGGSDLAAMKTVAKKVPGGWRISGEKSWITNATIADVMLVSAQTGSGTAGIARYVIETSASGVTLTGVHPLSVGHAVGLGGARFDDVFVGDANLVDPPGEAFKRSMENVNGARVHVAAMCVAALEASLGISIRYGNERTVFTKSLLEHQGLRWTLVDVANRMEAANLLVLRAAELIHAGQQATLAAAHAKKFATSIAVSGIESCMQAMGAHAVIDSLPLSRQLGEMKLASYADGTTEILNERIGTYLHKYYSFP